MAWCGVEVGGEWGHASNLLIIYDCDLPTSIPYCFHQLMSYVSLTDTILIKKIMLASLTLFDDGDDGDNVEVGLVTRLYTALATSVFNGLSW